MLEDRYFSKLISLVDSKNHFLVKCNAFLSNRINCIDNQKQIQCLKILIHC